MMPSLEEGAGVCLVKMPFGCIALFLYYIFFNTFVFCILVTASCGDFTFL